VSSEHGAGRHLPHPVCRIGEFVYLVGGASTESFERSFGHLVKRSLDVVAEGRPLVAFQTSSAIDEASFQPDWDFTDLDGLAGRLDIDATGRAKLLTLIFRLVAPSLGLRRDPVLRNVIEAVLATDGLPRGKAVVHAIEGADIAICEVPTRLRLAKGGLIIAFSDQLALGEVEAVEGILGEDGGRKLAAVDCSSTMPVGRALVVTSRGIAIADIDTRSYPDIRAFQEALCFSLPDALNMLAIFDPDARAALSALGRRETALPIVAFRSLGFYFELTHVLSMDHGLFVSGLLLDPDGLLEEVLAIDHGLADPSLMDQWLTAPARTTIEGDTVSIRRFHAFLARHEGVAAPASIAFRLQLKNGERHLAYMPDCMRDKRGTRAGILDAVVGGTMSPDMLSRIFRPALVDIQDACNGEQSTREVSDFGTASSRRISLVIPLYREMRFIRSQLVAFDVDPFLRAHCQIVYVVDDPLIAQRVRNMLDGAPNVFSLDIRLVILERNGGYALANNFGVREAAGDLVVLMNSDVTPEAPGWLQPIAERLSQLPAKSVIGPKLLYADQSLQHAGMYFFKLPNIGYWQNMHFFKGFGRDFPPANVEREVPAVTGALMMLRREDFLAVGGFTTDYVIGDYEDSDLCLKLRAMGGRCLYMPSVALLHFERQSMPDSDVDFGSTIYNRALHSARWSETIEALMSDIGEARHGL
jgi:GT2 family glycosyltransferase